MQISQWYKVLLLVWLVTGLPILIVAHGFGGGSFELPDLEYFSAIDILIWAIVWIYVLSPVLLVGFGLRRTKHRKDSDEA